LRWNRHTAARLACLLAATLSAGCGALMVRSPVPMDRTQDALVLGRDDLRYFLGRRATVLEAQFGDLMDGTAQVATDTDQEVHILGLSGGGANGAFAGGLLSGWSRTGTRPVFDVVSGVSTGALAAPFAFLGSDHDDLLENLYTTTSTRDVMLMRRLVSLFRADSAADSEGLRRLVETHVDEALLRDIAAAHASGRRLFVSTTDLDAGEGVIWDMGKIASLGTPEALGLFRAVLVASASIPVAFPPVYIPVSVDGGRYDEMHVDGGTTAQVFVLPPRNTSAATDSAPKRPRTHVWVIRNSRIIAEPMPTQARIAEIARRSLSVLIKSQGVGDLYRIYFLAQRWGAEFKLAYISDEFQERAEETFDPDYMRQLFDFGLRLGMSGSAWHSTPVGLEFGTARQGADRNADEVERP
jgi:predicted acylesterase/phospholipase RssA